MEWTYVSHRVTEFSENVPVYNACILLLFTVNYGTFRLQVTSCVEHSQILPK